MTYSRLVTSFSLALIMLVISLAPIGLPPPASVDAGHDDPTTSHLTPDGYIVRNVMFRITIPVCSDDLPLSTAAAARRWNTFFGGDGRVFELDDDGTVFESTDDECRADRLVKRLGIGSVLVVRDDPVDGECMGTACIFRLLTRPDTDWDTITGQPVIYVADYEVEGSDERDPLSDGHVRVTRSITHELGHVFGLEDYETDYCRAAPEGAPNPHHYADVPTIMGPAQRANGTSGVCHSPTPTARDKLDFQVSYVPEAPIILRNDSISPHEYHAVIAWYAAGVHVENGFEIQRKRADGTWETVGTHEALPLPRPRFTLPLPELDEVRQRARVTLRGQPLGLQRYRVVALTRAPLQDDVAASGEIRVIVKGPPPLAPTGLTASGVVMGINMTWDLATDDPPINGYQYRIDSGEWQDIPSSNASTISYQLRGMLVAGITYAVELRAVRALVPSAASSRVSATPTAPPRPPPRPDPYVWIQLVTGVNTVVWPGATILTATITEDIPISIIWYWDADAGEAGEWISYVTNPDAPAATKRLEELRTGETYVIRATEDYAWRVRRPASSRSARAQVAETTPDSGWTATVTCASGLGPIRLGAAPTEAEAITAANWIIDHPHGCAGSGIYTISDESGGG